MKDFAGSSITYYGLAREKLMNKYPWLISVLIILALICMTGLAMFLISDLVSFASNPDQRDASVGLGLKGLENGIILSTSDKEKSENISTNSSQSLINSSGQTSVKSSANMNASLPSSPAAKAVVATGKSSSSSSQSSVNTKSGNSFVTGHHSSSSSSSSKSSSASSAKKSSDTNNLTNETATNLMPTNQSINNSQRSDEIPPTQVLSSLPSTISSFTDPAKNIPAREPVSMIKFKTEATLGGTSEQGLNTDNGANTDGNTASDNTNKAQNSKAATKNTKLKTTTSSKNSKLTASSQVAKVKAAKEKIKANKDRLEENMKKKAAQLRSKAAKN